MEKTLNIRYKSDSPHESEYPTLLDVWESSLRATHHFLKKDDIEIIKQIIREEEVFNQLE